MQVPHCETMFYNDRMEKQMQLNTIMRRVSRRKILNFQWSQTPANSTCLVNVVVEKVH